MEKRRAIFVDVDDTLVRSVGTKQIPIPAAVAWVKSRYEEGHTLYCWSRGGSEYSRNVATELGIDALFAGFLPKPDVLLDDQGDTLLDHAEFVHPIDAE